MTPRAEGAFTCVRETIASGDGFAQGFTRTHSRPTKYVPLHGNLVFPGGATTSARMSVFFTDATTRFAPLTYDALYALLEAAITSTV